MTKLALNGGTPVRTRPFPPYNTIGEEEKRAVARILDSTVLSKFLGTWSEDFFGGPTVRALEQEWARFFGVRHAVTMNSATSGLYAALGAAGVEPGHEVIVSPYTMTASVTGALLYGAVPVFADIDPVTFCITPDTIRKVATPRTRAIVVVDLFGHPARVPQIMEFAEQRGITVIEDAAQAPGARLAGKFAGTQAHLGVFSLNYHKTIHTGEGGIVVTNDDHLAERLQLIRNHAEVVVEDKGVTDLTNMIGFNYRMTEIEAAIGREQLKKLDRLLAARIEAAEYLTRRLVPVEGLTLPRPAPDVRHGYYLYVMRYDAAKVGMPRDVFVAAVNAEGVPLSQGYVKPIYLQPIYQRRAHWALRTPSGSAIRYDRGLCPTTERMHFEEVVHTNVCHAGATKADLDDVATAIEKVLASAQTVRVGVQR